MADKPQIQIIGAATAMPTTSPDAGEQRVRDAIKPSLNALFLAWCKISIESFGGGSSTLLLMRREFVDRRQWLTAEEYDHFWSLSQISPGIILVAMSLLMGRRLGGTAGMILSLVGILVPSAAITVILTAGFALIQTLHPIQAMIQGVLPATAGIMLALSIQFARPLVRQSVKHGFVQSAECLVVIVGSTLALALFHLEVWLVLLAAAFICVAIFLPLATFFAPGGAQQKDEG